MRWHAVDASPVGSPLRLQVLQLQNKQDWARLHGYEVHQMAELVDSHMRPGPWQKVGLLRKVCALAVSHQPACLRRPEYPSFVCEDAWHTSHIEI